MVQVRIARQPIVDGALSVIGYELLFRDGRRQGPGADDDARNEASSRLLLRGFVDGGGDGLCDGKLAFLNIPGEWIDQGLAGVLPVDEVVLEIEVRDGAKMAPAVADEIVHLRAQGFKIAVDRGALHGRNDANAAVQGVDFVKLDIRGCDAATLRAFVREHPATTVIATHVESYETFEACRAAGVHGFQGYFLSRPHVIEEGAVASGRSRSVELLTTAMGDTDAIERQLMLDPVLTYRLLRVANSAYYRRGQVATTVRRALELLGEDGLRQWLAMVALASIRGKPSVLLDAAMIRARTAELLAIRSRRKGPRFYFMVGMFSLLDTLMDRPLASLLQALPGSERLQEALVDDVGDGARVLAVVVAQERGDFDGARLDPLDRGAVQQAYLDAIVWVREIGGLLRSEPP